jgi:hypothetical protein
MNPFSGLRPEIQLDIFVFIGDICEAIECFHASRAFRAVHRCNTAYLIRQLTPLAYDSDLRQDGLATICFPDSPRQSCEQRLAGIDAYVSTWGARALPDPFKTNGDVPGMLKVNFTFSVIQLYIDDYLITSTSPRLPRDCQRIPGWRNSSLISLQSQRNLVSDCWARLQRRSLNHNEQRRITRAFLRYEILYKIFGPQHRKRTPEDYGLRYRDWSAASPYSERLLQLDPFDAHATVLLNDLRMAMRFRRSTMCQRRLVMDYILAYRRTLPINTGTGTGIFYRHIEVN